MAGESEVSGEQRCVVSQLRPDQSYFLSHSWLLGLFDDGINDFSILPIKKKKAIALTLREAE